MKKVINYSERNIIIIIAGGDGSIAKFIEDLAAESVDVTNIKVF